MHDHAITNAYVVYSANNAASLQRAKSQKQFCLQLANALTAPAIALKRGTGHSPTSTLSCLTGKHFPCRVWSQKVLCMQKNIIKEKDIQGQ